MHAKSFTLKNIHEAYAHITWTKAMLTLTHVSDACMNTLSTGVPGAGLVSEQSDIYRHEMEKRGGAVRGG